MEPVLAVVIFLLGAVIGGVSGAFATYWMCRTRTTQAVESATHRSQQSLAILQERNDSKDQAILSLKKELEQAKNAKQEADRLASDAKAARATAEQKVVQLPGLLKELEQAKNAKQEAERIASEAKVARAAAEQKALQLPALIDDRSKKETRIDALHQDMSRARERIAGLAKTLDDERKRHQEKMVLLQQAKADFEQAFKALSGEALKSNNQAFLELAKATLEKYVVEADSTLEQRQKAVEGLVSPINASLEKVKQTLQTLDETRRQADVSLSEQIRNLFSSEENLRRETGRLVTALRSPTVRGRWGEITLHRVVEVAGMVEYCDFTLQKTVDTEDGKLRPDLVVKLPGYKNIVVDGKAPMQAYLDSLEIEDENLRNDKLKEHARQIRQHMDILSSKEYWAQCQPSPDFVVLFLPGEMFFSAALQQDKNLIEDAHRKNIILATPTTLISLLRIVAQGWSQESIASDAQNISNLGKQLYERLGIFAGHFALIRSGLEKAVKAYNDSVGSLESRVLVSARKLKELVPTAADEIEAPEGVSQYLRSVQAQGYRESEDDQPDDEAEKIQQEVIEVKPAV